MLTDFYYDFSMAQNHPLYDFCSIIFVKIYLSCAFEKNVKPTVVQCVVSSGLGGVVITSAPPSFVPVGLGLMWSSHGARVQMVECLHGK